MDSIRWDPTSQQVDVVEPEISESRSAIRASLVVEKIQKPFSPHTSHSRFIEKLLELNDVVSLVLINILK